MLNYQDREWEIEQSIERNKKGANIPIPDWYYQKKGVPDNLRWFWQAFWELDTCRTYEEGIPRRIPWTAMLQYAQYHEIAFEYIWYLIVVIDNAYIDWKVKKRTKELEDMKKDSKIKKGKKHGK